MKTKKRILCTFSKSKTFLRVLPLFFGQITKVFGLLTFSSLLLTSVIEVNYAQTKNNCSDVKNGSACNNNGRIINNNIIYPSKEPNNIDVKSRLIGTWKASTIEFGQSFEIFLVLRRDGTELINFKSINGSQISKSGHWTYSNGIMTEKIEDGEIARGSIEFINPNYFSLTILDNGGHGYYTGLKRHYYRYNQ